jgi:hypothetical protein
MSLIEILIFIITISVVLIAISSIWGSEVAKNILGIPFIVILGLFTLSFLYVLFENGFEFLIIN